MAPLLQNSPAWPGHCPRHVTLSTASPALPHANPEVGHWGLRADFKSKQERFRPYGFLLLLIM